MDAICTRWNNQLRTRLLRLRRTKAVRSSGRGDKDIPAIDKGGPPRDGWNQIAEVSAGDLLRRRERLSSEPFRCGLKRAWVSGTFLARKDAETEVGLSVSQQRGYVADTVFDGVGAAALARGGDSFIGRRPKRRTVSTHAEQSRPSRSRIGATVEGMRPRLSFTI